MRLSLGERIHAKLALKAVGGRMPLALERGVLSITFDDFPKSAWTEGGPVLDAHGVKGTYYVVGGFRGQVSEGQRQFDDADLEALVEARHELACHTFDHTSALKASPAEFAASVRRNSAFVAERFPGYRMESFAFPFGDVSLTAGRALAAFSNARGIIPALNTSPVRPLLLSAVGLESRKRAEYDIPALIERASIERAWLILYTHDVSDSPSPFGCTPAELDAVLSRATASGLRIAPVREVISGEGQARV